MNGTANAIGNIEYKLEWMDHLFEIYRSFKRRNDPDEWICFLRRPEMADKALFDEIRSEVLSYMLNYGHISQKTVKMLEDTFHFVESEDMIVEKFGLWAFDYYRKGMLGREELPPYRLFGELKEDVDYDAFLNAFEDFFAVDSEESNDYKVKLDALKSFGLEHQYIALAESTYHQACGEYGNALAVLMEVEECTSRFSLAGYIMMDLGYYEDAELQFKAAVERDGPYRDRDLTVAVYLAKYHAGKIQEALDFLETVKKQGYGYMVLNLEKKLLEEICERLTANTPLQDLSEEGCRLLCRYLMLAEDYVNAAALCIKCRERGFDSAFWWINEAESYVRTGNFPGAERIVDDCYSGKIKMSSGDFDMIRRLKAELLFSQRKTKEAYEIMENLCAKTDSDTDNVIRYAEMCAVTGRMDQAIKIYRSLRFSFPENPAFAFELGKCMLKSEKPQIAHTMFESAFKNGEAFYQAVYYMAQASVDSGEIDDLKHEIESLEGSTDEKYVKFLKGQAAEMQGDFRTAKDIYYSIMDTEKIEKQDRKFLGQVCERYLIMKVELNATVIGMIGEIKKCLEYVPEYADLWIMLGSLHEDSDFQPEKARGCFEKAHDCDPYNEIAIAKLIEHGMNDDNWRKVLGYCNEAIVNTQDAEYYMVRANCELELDMDEAFAADIAEFVRRGGDERDTYELCSRYALKNCDYDKAMEIYRKQLRDRDNKTVPCYREMAVCMCKQGKVEEACSLLKSAISTGGRNPEWILLLFEIQMNNGFFSEAESTLKLYKDANGLGLLDDSYNYLTAKLALQSGKMMKACHTAEMIASYDGEKLCAQIYMLEGKYRGASHIFKKLMRKEPQDTDNYEWMTLCQALWGKQRNAAEWAAKGMEVFLQKYDSMEKLSRPDQLYQYAIFSFFSGNTPDAYSALRKTADAAPCYEKSCGACYKAYYGTGICKAFEGDAVKAAAAFRKAIELRPYNPVCMRMYKILCR